jgi:flavin reductase (DIM6/NTAB) family NADH-FMN oxidoreductase RutF
MDIRESLKEVMRVFPQGVTVVTTKYKNKYYGLTVSAFTSISLDPPLIMISISKFSHTHEAFTNSDFFSVNFLADDQKTIADRFAGRMQLQDKFQGINYTIYLTDTPIISGVRAFIECKKYKVYDGGDHSIILGEVINAKKSNDKSPLVFYTQQYTTIITPEKAYIYEDLLWW